MNEHARRYPAGNIPATADFRDCCRNISEQASRSTNDGGVGAGAGGPHWSHDALGAYTYFDYSYTASMKKHLQNAFAHSSLPHSCCKKYFGQLHDSTAQGRWHAGVLRGHPPLGEETLDGVHAVSARKQQQQHNNNKNNNSNNNNNNNNTAPGGVLRHISRCCDRAEVNVQGMAGQRHQQAGFDRGAEVAASVSGARLGQVRRVLSVEEKAEPGIQRVLHQVGAS